MTELMIAIVIASVVASLTLLNVVAPSPVWQIALVAFIGVLTAGGAVLAAAVILARDQP